jgi:hypothetical protein
MIAISEAEAARIVEMSRIADHEVGKNEADCALLTRIREAFPSICEDEQDWDLVCMTGRDYCAKWMNGV